MVRLFLTIALIFVYSTSWGVLIEYDESVFDSLYEQPTEVINFNVLKDGTTYENAAPPHNLTTDTTHHDDRGKWQVREYGWSDNYLIRTTNGYGGFWTAMRWNGSSIGSNIGNVPLSIISLVDPTPMAMYVTSDTYSGFVGLIPEFVDENHFLFYLPGLRVHEIRFGFSSVSYVPEPSTLLLMATGLAGFGFASRKRKTA